MMLLDKILEMIDLPSIETYFSQPPGGSYVVWLDSVERRGSDTMNCITEHSLTLELYSYDREEHTNSKAEIDQALDAFVLEFERGDTTHLTTEGLFMTPYYFDYLEKE